MMKLKLSVNTQILRNQKVSVYLKNTRKQKVMELYLLSRTNCVHL